MSQPALHKALVRILIDDRMPRQPLGAGFLALSRYVITCAHVITDVLDIPRDTAAAPNQTILLDFPLLDNAPILQANVVGWHPLREINTAGDISDIAVLELAETVNLPQNALPAPVMLPKEMEFVHRPVIMCGFPRGMDYGDRRNGVIAGLVGNGRVQIDFEAGRRTAAPGFSGTPVWDAETDAVCGIIDSINTRDGETSAYMIPVKTLIKAWPELNASVQNAHTLPSDEDNSMTNAPYDLFISNVKQDQDIAFRLYNDLKQAGVKPWLNSEDSVPGRSEKAQIHEAIQNSRYFMPLISANSVSQRGMVQRELNIASDILDEFPMSDIFIIPVRLDNTRLTDYRFQDIKPADFTQSYAAGFQQLMRVLAPDKRVEKEKIVTPPPQKPKKQPPSKMEWVTTLLACQHVRDRGSRDVIVQELPADIRDTIARNNADRVDVINIVTRCMDFDGGIEKLVEQVGFLEGGSRCMQAIEKLLNRRM